jgi:predicted amidohydrolase YtcJ
MVGTAAEVDARRGPHTRVIDLQGRRVVPGFIDAHVHFLTGGFEVLGPDLHGTRDVHDFAQRLRAAAARVPAGTWITGGGWDHEGWPDRQLPHRRHVDALVPEHPVCVRRTDGHLAFANGKALELAGIDQLSADPSGGVIVREPGSRLPTGVLKDAAMEAVLAVIPEPSDAAKLAAAQAGLALARREGVTTIHDMDGGDSVAVFRALERQGLLTVRVRSYYPIPTRQRAYRDARGNTALVKVMGVKAFADGSLGASTAWMFEEFSDAPGNRGLRDPGFARREAFLQSLLEVDAQGLQAAVHAIGDAANHELLEVYAELNARRPAGDRRSRIEHAQHLTPPDIVRFARLGVVASVQPYHAIDDGRWAERKLGPARTATTYAFRSLLDSGAALALGSDWFVAPLDPLRTLHAAVTRATLDGRHPDGWVPAQKITVIEALVAHTEGSAHAAFDETRLGRIAPGFLADLVVLDADPLTVDATRIGDIGVVLTVVDGRVVFAAEDGWPGRR